MPKRKNNNKENMGKPVKQNYLWSGNKLVSESIFPYILGCLVVLAGCFILIKFY